MIEKKFFDNYGGRDSYLYTLRGDGIEVGITDFGAALHSLRISTKRGYKDVVLGFPTISERLQSGTYCGAVIGRVANRISRSRFTLGGREFAVSRNEGENCNHGGAQGFDTRFFEVETDGDRLIASLESADGDQGFPANLKLKVEFGLAGKSLEVKFTAVSDGDTVWAPTYHPYFNLNGEGSGSILNTLLEINADKYTPVNGELIPTGEICDVAGTRFDFRSERPVASASYDNNFVLNGERAASAYCAESGIRLTVYSDLTGFQLYTGGFLRGRGKSGEYKVGEGFCLEPQYFPNAVNTRNFISPVLKANTPKTHYIRYEFTTE